MKYQIPRRAGALVLALALALTLAVPAWAADPEGGGGDPGPVVEVTPGTLTLGVGESETLKATVRNGEDEVSGAAFTWSSSDSTIAAVDTNGKVTGVKEGSATITATHTGSGKTGTCAVTVTKPSVKLLSFTQTSLVDPEELTVNVDPVGADYSKGVFEWTAAPVDEGTVAPTFTRGTATTGVVSNGPGEFNVTVSYVEDGKELAKASIKVIISGITLTETDIKGMFVGEVKTVAVKKAYGAANDGISNASNVEWISSDYSVVSVMSNSGDLYAQGLGTATITATKAGKYSATCEVEVVEDTSVIAGPYTATTSKPLILSDVKGGHQVYTDLDQISIEKTDDSLSYITNLEVVRVQGALPGTLYYNYIAEADTGAGVGPTYRFAKDGGDGTMLNLDKLYFVPKQGFKGTVDITFTGWSKNNGSFSGVIRVNVGTGTGTGGGSGVEPISYRVRAGEPVWFLTSDFNNYCQGVNGRNFNYVVFNLPPTSQGTLYYNYVAGSGMKVATSTQFTRSGRYTVDDVCFVPDTAFTGDMTITFRGQDSSGTAFSGEVLVTVDPVITSGDPNDVYISGEQGQPVELRGELFNVACQDTIKDTLSFVIFKLPDPSEGVLYYNYQSSGSYDSRVTAAARYYYSGVPALNNVSFVPASNDTGRIAIPYTGYGSSGTSFAGTLYIDMGKADHTTIRYFVAKEGSVTFSANDFNTAGLYQLGVGVDHVTFTVPEDTSLGALYYNYRGTSSDRKLTSSDSTRYNYYISPTGGQMGVGLITFIAENKTGTVTVPYKAYKSASDTQPFEGSVVIQVGVLPPNDVNLSCNTSGQVQLSSSTLSSVCGAVMSESLSYIEITSLPDPESGHLYLNYSGFGTGAAVKKGDRFYCIGSPGINRLSFVPRSGFTGEAEITYIGCSTSSNGVQEQVSGRIVVRVSQSRTSWSFDDMGGHVWAIDPVEYLYRNGTVKGVGDRRYNPTGSITKGDFTLMLVRAYGLTASGSASFNDVPPDSYYADAIRIAALLGIAGGSNGNYNPKTALSRQDAMLMIFNALKVSGMNITNGLAADLSAYHDEGEISPEAREAMGSLVQMGVVKGVGNGYLQPQRLLNRAEAAVLLHTIMTL